MEYAIVIGINDYKGRPLKGAVNDAVNFAGWLKENALISSPETNLKLLTSDESNEIAMGHEIDIAIDSLIQDARKRQGEHNRLYFYFSGHGLGSTYDNTALCLRLWPEVMNHCFSSLIYKSWFINKSAFDEILIFLDCCRETDVLTESRAPMHDWATAIGNRPVKILICNSTIYGKLSYETPVDSDKKRGIFTAFLLDSLKGDAGTNDNGEITALGLKKHIEDHFEGYAKKHEKFQQAQVSIQGPKAEDMVVCTVQKLTEKHNCEITFERDSNVTLFTPELSEKKVGDVTKGTIWYQKLKKGMYLLKDNRTGETKTIINFSENTLSHEQF